MSDNDEKNETISNQSELISFLKQRLRDTDNMKTLVSTMNGDEPWSDQELLLEPLLFLDMLCRGMVEKMPPILIDSAISQFVKLYVKLWTHETKKNKRVVTLARTFATTFNKSDLKTYEHILKINDKKKDKDKDKDKDKE